MHSILQAACSCCIMVVNQLTGAPHISKPKPASFATMWALGLICPNAHGRLQMYVSEWAWCATRQWTETLIAGQ